MDCFAEPVIGRRFAPTRWLAMTETNNGTVQCHCLEARPSQLSPCWRRSSAHPPRPRFPRPSQLRVKPWCSRCMPKARRSTNARPAPTARSPGYFASRSRRFFRRQDGRPALCRTELGVQRRQRGGRPGRRHRPGQVAKDIPWLKLGVTSRRGNGVLSPATTVQRINTVGGKLNGACYKAGTYESVPYSADYVFLRKG